MRKSEVLGFHLDHQAKPTRQVNVLLTAAEAKRLDDLADGLGWSKRAVIVAASDLLEATLKERAAITPTPDWAFDWALQEVQQ